MPNFYGSIALATGAGFLISGAPSAYAAKKPVPIEQIEKCITKRGEGQLDTIFSVSSMACSNGSAVINQDVRMESLEADPSVSISRDKTDGTVGYILGVSIHYSFSNASYKGFTIDNPDMYRAGFFDGRLLMDGKLLRLHFQSYTTEPPNCYKTLNVMDVWQCDYREFVNVVLTRNSFVKLIDQNIAARSLPVKLVARSGDAFEFSFDPLEMQAVLARYERLTGGDTHPTSAVEKIKNSSKISITATEPEASPGPNTPRLGPPKSAGNRPK